MLNLRREQARDIDARIGNASGRHRDVFASPACLSKELLSRYDYGHLENISWAECALLFSEDGRTSAVLDSLETASQSKVENSDRTSLFETPIKRNC